MEFYSSTWKTIELYLLSCNGQNKWILLSFYIGPPFLILCRFFLWLKALIDVFCFIIIFFLDSARLLVVRIYSSVVSAATYWFSFIRIRVHLRSGDRGVLEIAEDYQAFHSFSFLCQAAAGSEPKVFAEETIDIDKEEEDEIELREVYEDFVEFDNLMPNRGDNAGDTNESTSHSYDGIGEVMPNRDGDAESLNQSRFLGNIAMAEDGDSLSMPSPSPIFIWSWPESPLAHYGKAKPSYSTEEDESETMAGMLHEDTPSPHEHLCLQDTGISEDSASACPQESYCSELSEWPRQEEETGDRVTNAVLLAMEENSTRKESDSFYLKYSERMKWFDALGDERTCGINAVMDKTFESTTMGSPIWGDKSTKKMLLKSLQIDVELAYVAQICLSWEALHYQYQRVDRPPASSCSRARVSGNMRLAKEFHKFHVLIDRFIEEETNGRKRYEYFVGRRSSGSLKGLLQVPELSGFSVDVENQTSENISVLETKKMREAMEECIRAFFDFLETEKGKSSWKLKSSLWSSSPVEDPRDLQLFHDLTKRHQKMVQVLKDLHGKKEYRISSTNPGEGYKRKEILFTMIDLKLVSRVLKMKNISSSQLKWCQSKVDNISFHRGTVVRGGAYPLFPVS
ncbi:hypothetical protein SAY86_021943 [Trapa natans]|uniref:Ribosomal protein L34Ae n=1 Tax=Trapa natans TaxID=22666 RepID=A0AAN7MVK1_TRANT|nr:hypothetical protein SAY86_021943 [Trapa natans]